MGDNFNINNVEQLINNSPLNEISDISKIIKEMINIKSDSDRVIKKRTRPYDVCDKVKLNEFTNNLQERIKKYHIESYDVVDDAINCIEEYEATIKGDLFDYYWDVYLDVLTDLSINVTDLEEIKSISDKIYISIINKIDSQIFSGRNSDIETNISVNF